MTEPTGLPENLPEDHIQAIAQRVADEHRPPAPEPAHRRPLWREPVMWLVFFALAALLGLLLWGLLSTQAKQNAQSAREDKLSGALATANARITALGGTPVATPPATASPVRGATGARGPGPSSAQVLAAVNYYCTFHSGCTGTPSKAQVLAAVTGYCQATGNPCRGATGPSGSTVTGPSGATGQTGQAGPGPTDAQVEAAVGLYCDAHGSCQGATGPTGATGSTGRGITSIDCTDLGITTDQLTLTVHYDDGTSETVTCTPPNTTSSASQTP